MASLLDRFCLLAVGAWARVEARARSARCRRLCQVRGDGTRFGVGAEIQNPSETSAIEVGGGCLVMGRLLVRHGGTVRVGDWCYLGPHSEVWAFERVTIGARVFISHGVQIFDNNSHALSAAERHARYRELCERGRHSVVESVRTAAIDIGDDVWIGFNAAIMKGVRIGRGAVIGACSVVVHDVPDFAIVVGNPARIVGEAAP